MWPCWSERNIRAPVIAICGQPEPRRPAYLPRRRPRCQRAVRKRLRQRPADSRRSSRARIARLYQSAPSIRSARKLCIATRPVRIRLQRYTPTVASSNSTVQAANPTSIHTGTVTRSPHRGTRNRYVYCRTWGCTSRFLQKRTGRNSLRLPRSCQGSARCSKIQK